MLRLQDRLSIESNARKNMIKNIIWDFDGTLFDTYTYLSKVFVNLLNVYGVEEDIIIVKNCLSVSIRHTIQQYMDKYSLPDSFVKELQDMERQYGIFEIRPFDDVLMYFDKTTLCETKNFLYTHRDDSAYQYLCKYGLLDRFIQVLTSNDGFPPKPNTDAFLYLIEQNRLNISETMVVGDRETDLLAAQKAGLVSCFYDPSNKGNKYADYNISSMMDLYYVIENHGGYDGKTIYD